MRAPDGIPLLAGKVYQEWIRKSVPRATDGGHAIGRTRRVLSGSPCTGRSPSSPADPPLAFRKARFDDFAILDSFDRSRFALHPLTVESEIDQPSPGPPGLFSRIVRSGVHVLREDATLHFRAYHDRGRWSLGQVVVERLCQDAVLVFPTWMLPSCPARMRAVLPWCRIWRYLFSYSLSK